LFARLLRFLAGAVCRHPRWFVYPQFALFALCVYYTAFSPHHLQLDMDRDDLVGSDKSYHQRFVEYRKEFPGEDELAVVVESNDHERNRQFVERLAAKLELETNLFTDVFYKGDLKSLGPKALLFVPDEELIELRQRLALYRPFIQKFTAATNLDSLFDLINQQFRTAKREENQENNALIKAIPALERIVVQAGAALSTPGTPVSPGVTTLFGAGEEPEKVDQASYITFADGRIYLVTARARSEDPGSKTARAKKMFSLPDWMLAKSEDPSSKAVQRMRQLMAETTFEVPGLNVGLTGEPVLDYDELEQSKRDAALAAIVSLVVSSLIFITAYREAGRPLKTVLCLVIGLGYSMAFTTLAVGHLNILTITFAPILIGLAIDFGIHLITRYEEETRHGRSKEAAVDKAIVFTGQGIITGALTTAGAFVAMWLTDFKGIQEMGIISGGGLAMCLVPMMTLLPVLLMRDRGDRGRMVEINSSGGHRPPLQDAVTAEAKRARIEEIWLRRPGWVMAATGLLCVAALTQFGKVYFDYNLLNMQSKGLAAVVYEKKLLYSGQSVLYAAVVADSEKQACEFEQAAKKLPSVASVDGDDKGDSIFHTLTSDQSAKLETVRGIKSDLAEFHFAPVDPGPVDLQDLGATLWETMGYMMWARDDDETRKTHPELAAQFQSLYDSISSFRVKMLSGDPAMPERLEQFQEALFKDIHATFTALQVQDASGGLKPRDLPPDMSHRFIGLTGKFRVLVFPKKDIWQRENQEEFVQQLRSVIPPERVTGTPVQLLEYETLLKTSYQQAALYALGAIALMVLWQFQSLLCVILALLPVAIGSIWMAGIMGLAGIPFNPADIMTLPLVIGIGVTNGIHILNRFAEEHNPGILAKSTGKAVLVSGLTAMTGFGSLILGRHQGIQSLGLVMTIGIGTCMVAGLTFLPAVLNLLARRGWTLQIKRPGSDNARPLPDPEEPRKKPKLG
jgi:hopanoid biosynthesis associated RND transporter like protein HpnN